jgi:hypothetical protein
MTSPQQPGPVLYVALVPLKVYSLTATWFAPIGGVLPLDPNGYQTQLLLANGSIELAPGGAADTVTPPRTLRGQPGLHTGVSN